MSVLTGRGDGGSMNQAAASQRSTQQPAAAPADAASLRPGAGPADLCKDPSALRAQAELRRRSPRAEPLKYLPDVHPARLPRHIAVIMDGNGRWATQRGFPRAFGHRNGAAAVRRLLEQTGRLGIEVLTLYSFSVDNWKRPKDEVEALMQMYRDYMDGEMSRLMDEGIRFVQIGSMEGLPDEVRAGVRGLMDLTAGNTAATLCVAVNYGSRDEITRAVRRLAADAASGRIDPATIGEADISARLDTAGLPDPDLLIRTGGEMRVSNFLLWQISYAELYVTDVLWPDFTAEHLNEAIRQYAGRSRRFGGLNGDGPEAGA
ncbi:MAG: di-trans,poly-cis-decaprenylcistransferase [Phycisphaeraceae bacterium]|nr:di-trans,poly-cis-decaprenylcistransferase [Phycisphaeraceae bacterium]